MAACNVINTGPRFLWATLANIDCHARGIGAYGFGALSDPTSAVGVALTLLLTIFVALFGIRLLLGERMSPGDLVTDILRVGIVLALATSWPAWRVVGYDLALDGPMQVANLIGAASGLPGGRGDIRVQLQDADNGIVAITAYGSGRLTGGVAAGTDLGDSPAGIALGDQSALGTARTIFLGATIGSFAFVRLGAGILLALAPLMAGLLLLVGTRSLFFGWIRGLVFMMLANLFLMIAQETQLAMFYPWMRDVLAQRGSGMFTVSAPTELLVLCLAYAALAAGLIYLAARISFLPSFSVRNTPAFALDNNRFVGQMQPTAVQMAPDGITNAEGSHAQTISRAVRQSMLREDRRSQDAPVDAHPAVVGGRIPSIRSADQDLASSQPALGASYRRSYRRLSAATRHRDAS